MDHGLIDRVAGLVREDAGRKTGHNLVTLVIRSHGKHTSKDGKSGSNRGNENKKRLWKQWELSYLVLEGALEDVVINLDVLPEEVDLVLHVLEEAPDHGGQVNDVCGLVLLKASLSALIVAG